ncbi:Serine protease, subtilisin family [Micromonospora inyonensis]|uniref:Serine protease, subtilisin family n=2 Tax=Micromonospora inyonensis TaxID=47866 RepID=A0A1C6S880_9ACTN|nr:Serine protease, subtilisin family [Micromonospora inyonensis]
MKDVGAAWRRRLVGSVATAGMAALFLSATASPVAAAEGPILGAGNPDAIPNSYIVVLKESRAADTQAMTRQMAAQFDVRVEYTYSHAVRGFAGTMSPTDARRLAAQPEVAYVEQNAEARITATQPSPPSWGLDRIDQPNLPLNSSYTYPNTAGNVRAYVIDTGIRTSHTDFGVRASWGTNTTGDGNNSDCNGHGTHVAGTIGGAAYGVAKEVSLIAVKVLGCTGSGSWAGVTAGVDWVTAHHTTGVPAVANMSLGGSGSNATLENAVRNSIADGVVYALASGNNNSDACNFTPARVPEAITVNASTSTDARASFSNWGTCTDIFAPGQDITSAWHTGDTATNTISGTSMAAPHVAGAAALVLGANPGLSPAQVAGTLTSNGTPNKITNPGTGSPNLLLHVPSGTVTPGTATLYRHWNGRDHVSSTSVSISGYVNENAIGKLHTTPVAGTKPIYQCVVSGWDHMTSGASNCEGQANAGIIGYVYASPPAEPHRAVHRCRMSTGDHFDSPASNCEGQIYEHVIGYLLL